MSDAERMSWPVNKNHIHLIWKRVFMRSKRDGQKPFLRTIITNLLAFIAWQPHSRRKWTRRSRLPRLQCITRVGCTSMMATSKDWCSRIRSNSGVNLCSSACWGPQVRTTGVCGCLVGHSQLN